MDFTTSSEIYPLGCLSCHSSLVKSRYSSRISVFQLFYIHPKRRRFNHELSPFNWVSEFWVKIWWFELLGIAANAGFLSGFSGIESVPGPELPQLDFLNKLNGLVWSSSLFILLWAFNWYSETQNGFRFSPLFCRRKPEEVCWIWRKIQVISPAQGAPWTIQVE